MNFLKKLWQHHKLGLITVGTAVISAAVMYQIMPLAVVAGGMCVLIAHEYGHYFLGYAGGGDVSPPFFVPLIIFTIGGTRIKNAYPSAKARIAIAGALAGGLAVLLMSLVGIATLGSISILAMSALIVHEFFAATLGSDGKRYRNALKGV